LRFVLFVVAIVDQQISNSGGERGGESTTARQREENTFWMGLLRRRGSR
jgi:hypothetical protein